MNLIQIIWVYVKIIVLIMDIKIDSKIVKCECGVKNKELIISELINQTDIFSHNFTSKEESSNMFTMKCYHTLFTKNGLVKNICSYILIFIILYFLLHIHILLFLNLFHIHYKYNFFHIKPYYYH